MKTLLGILLSWSLLAALLPAATAQDSTIAFADDINQSVIYTDENGNDVMALTVTEVDHDFPGYLDGQYAKHGYSYRMVAFTVENISDSTANVNLMSFTIIDSFGYSHYRTHIQPEEGYEFENDVDVAAGEVLEQELVFELPAHVGSMFFRWEHEFRTALLVNISPDGDAPAVARGLRSPASISDDFANEIATVEVLTVRGEWDQYNDWGAPDDGEVYWAIKIRVTNASDRPLDVQRYRFNVIDQQGVVNRPTFVSVSDSVADQQLTETQLNPGESVEGFVVYSFAEGTRPILLMWEDRFGSSAYVILVKTSSTPDIATPVAD